VANISNTTGNQKSKRRIHLGFLRTELFILFNRKRKHKKGLDILVIKHGFQTVALFMKERKKGI